MPSFAVISLIIAQASKNLFALTFVIKSKMALAEEFAETNNKETHKINSIKDFWLSFKCFRSISRKTLKITANGTTKNITVP